jgi:hypothetical protein
LLQPKKIEWERSEERDELQMAAAPRTDEQYDTFERTQQNAEEAQKEAPPVELELDPKKCVELTDNGPWLELMHPPSRAEHRRRVEVEILRSQKMHTAPPSAESQFEKSDDRIDVGPIDRIAPPEA